MQLIEEVKEAKEQEVKNEIYFLYRNNTEVKAMLEKMSYNRFLDLTIILNIESGLKANKENKEANTTLLVEKHNNEKAKKLEKRKEVLNELLNTIKVNIYKTSIILRDNPFTGISYSERHRIMDTLKELKISADIYAITISLKDDLTDYEFNKRKKDLKNVNNYIVGELNKLENPEKYFNN